jgi:hypothetical protein
MQGFEARRTTLAPGTAIASTAGEWLDELVILERGTLDVQCDAGTTCRFAAGDVLVLSALPVRSLANPGPREACLLSIRRRRTQSVTSER